jgi:NitT/TauT family transport system substrate-binding protein
MDLSLIIGSAHRRISRSVLCSIFFWLMAAVLSACSLTSSPAKLTPVTVQLSWLNQAQFAGLYAADQQGYYAEEGLQVSFVEGGPNIDFISPVAKGAAQFGMAQPADLILARAKGMPVRSIAVIYQRSPVVFFALSDTGITRPQDFVGKKIRTAVTIDQTLQALMAQEGIHPDQYETVSLPSDIKQFASGDVPVWGGFINVFVLEVQKAGYQINIISPDDYGIHFYGDILITTDDLIAKQPDTVKRFLRATLKGWKYALEHPETAGMYVQKYNPKADPEMEAAKMIKSIPLVNTGDDLIGWMKAELWNEMADNLRKQGALTKPLNIDQVYTLQFLQEIYGK